MKNLYLVGVYDDDYNLVKVIEVIAKNAYEAQEVVADNYKGYNVVVEFNN